jgi:YHS domain-containing protein
LILLFQADHSNKNDAGVILSGFDVVSYFSESGPTPGKEQWSRVHQGATYYFNSQDNLNKFIKSPNLYVPAYGGWCAYAMGETGDKVKIDPKTYKIIDNQLYLFYNFWGNNTLEDWNKNEPLLRSQADLNWRRIIGSTKN